MDIIEEINCEILNTLKRVILPELLQGEVDTIHLIYKLAVNRNWQKADYENVDFLSKRIDISSKLFLAYKSNGMKAVDDELKDEHSLELVIAILLKAAIFSANIFSANLALKRFNVLFKALDMYRPCWLPLQSILNKELDSLFSALVFKLSTQNLDFSVTLFDEQSTKLQSEKVIPLTVLFYEGPIARAYLETLRSVGLKPKEIVNLVSAKDITTKKVVGRWLPRAIRTHYAANIQRINIHFWPKRIRKQFPKFVDSIFSEILKKLGFSMSTILGANSLLPLELYSNNVSFLLVDGLDDQLLHLYAANQLEGAVLFTGGGILPAKLLALPNVKFIHIHPGYLPSIRGADCALWSSLIYKYFSASCFYMAPGIDTGEVIKPCWLPRLSFEEIDFSGTTIDKYRAIYSFIDPWVRSFVLRDVLLSAKQKYDHLESVEQTEEEGLTYHFMHERLRKVALENLFNC